MKQYEFQFRFGGKMGQKTSFGFDVMAATVAEAVEKANRFLDSAEPGTPSFNSGAERVWVNVARQATRRDIDTILRQRRRHDVKEFEAKAAGGLMATLRQQGRGIREKGEP